MDLLSSSEVASDCLLLVTGVRNDEMAVIERTPTRSEIRHPDSGFVAVANEYLALEGEAQCTPTELLETSSGRYARAAQLLADAMPTTPEGCLECAESDPTATLVVINQL